MNILVTGANGFLGKSLIKILASSDKFTTYALDTRHDIEVPGVHFLNGDITNIEAISDFFNLVDVVVHYASVADIYESNEHRSRALSVNIIGTNNVLELCVRNEVKRIIFSSSIYVYSDLGGIYKISKQASESLIHFYSEKFGLKYSILKLGSLYGPTGNHFNFIYNSLVSAYKTGIINRLGVGDELREYIHIDDVNMYVFGILSNLNASSEDVILSGHQKMRVSELLDMINEIMGGDIKINYIESEKFEGHYKYTPYSFEKRMARKIILDSYIDIGNGIIECLKEIKANEDL